MNIFFDVDYTLISSTGSLRPGVRECFQKLIDDGHKIYIWSGMGLRWHEIRHNNLEGFVSGVFHKPLHDYWEAWEQSGVDIKPDFVIDDHIGVPQAFGGIFTKAYYFPDERDTEMEGIYLAIRSYAETGNTLHPRFWHPPGQNLK